MSLTPGSPVAPLPVREEVDALKKPFLEEQQQQMKASSTYQSRNRADPGRALLPTAPMFKRPTSTLTNSSAPSELGTACSGKGITSNANTSCWESEDVRYIRPNTPCPNRITGWVFLVDKNP